MAWLEFYGCHMAHKGPTSAWIKVLTLVTMDPLWNSHCCDCHCFLVACGDGWRELSEVIREYIFFSIAGGFHLHEVYGQDLERMTGQKMWITGAQPMVHCSQLSM